MGKVDGGSTINPDNLTVAQLENLLEIQDKILLLLLQDYKSRISNWLQVNGKGPLSAFEMRMLEDLPGCFPADENVLIPLRDEVIPEIENDKILRNNIISELRSDPDFQADFDALALKFNSPADVSRSEIPDDDWEKIDLKACPKVLDFEFSEMYNTEGINKNTLVFLGDNYQEIITSINNESVCYYGNADKTKIKLEFKPILQGKDEYPKIIYLKPEVKFGEQVINNTNEVYKAGKDKESGGYTSKKAFSFELESKITRYSDISITFYWSADGKQNWQQVMEYSPIIYTTLRKAVHDQWGNVCNLDEHLLYFTCSLSPDYSETSLFDAIWSKIIGLKLNTNDFGLSTGIPIGYYFSGNAANNLENLLVLNSGICNAFQDLMNKALQTQGLSATNASISMGADEGFLVKAWEYSGTGTSGNSDYPYINYFDLNRYEPPYLTSGKYRWTDTPEVERMPDDEENLGGQNNNKPPANFYIHQVVEYNGRIYDPSYGKSFDNIEKWKEQCIDGIYIDGGIKELKSGIRAKSWLIRK